jgi:hypothetical protein
MPLASYNLGDPKIHKDGFPHQVQHNIGRFDVAMNHPTPVGIIDRITDIRHILNSFDDG